MGIELILEMAASADPSRVVLGPRESGITAAAMARLTAAGATHLRNLGARHVVFVGVNDPQFPLTVLSAARAGLPVAPLNYRLTSTALQQQIERLDNPLVICDDAYTSHIGYQARVLTTDEWLAVLDTGQAGELPTVDDDSPAVTLFTSGTTATPKAVIVRHSNLLSYVLQTTEFASADPTEAALVSVPPYHIAGIGTILTNLYIGRRVVYLADFTAQSWIETVRREQVSSAMVVPTMLSRIVEAAGDHADVPSLRAIAYGGARVTRPVLEQALAAFPDVAFTNAYGLTETSSTIAVLGPDDHRAAMATSDPTLRKRLSSAGQFVPGIEGEIRHPDGAVAESGEIGELWVRGSQVSGEYDGLGSVLEDGWFPTRDLAHLDPDGYLFLHGRSDDTIIRGGENISPAEIEDVLVEHPDVLEVAVVGTPDDEWGQRITAIIVPRTGSTSEPVAFREFVRARLRSSRTPDEVVLRAELPYTATGKLLRRDLAQSLSSTPAR